MSLRSYKGELVEVMFKSRAVSNMTWGLMQGVLVTGVHDITGGLITCKKSLSGEYVHRYHDCFDTLVWFYNSGAPFGSGNIRCVDYGRNLMKEPDHECMKCAENTESDFKSVHCIECREKILSEILKKSEGLGQSLMASFFRSVDSKEIEKDFEKDFEKIFGEFRDSLEKLFQ